MYSPKAFRQDDPAALAALIHSHPFGTLIVRAGDAMEVAHVPFLLDGDAGPHGRLRCHLAHANPWWQAVDGKVSALAAFTGPQHYISPDWYDSEDSASMVPTWNYVAVHAEGVPEILGDDDLRRLLDDLSAQEEGRLAPKKPWTTDKMAPGLFAGMRKAVVGLSIPIDRIEGKWKMGQNRKDGERLAAARALRAQGSAAAVAVAETMERAGKPSG